MDMKEVYYHNTYAALRHPGVVYCLFHLPPMYIAAFQVAYTCARMD